MARPLRNEIQTPDNDQPRKLLVIQDINCGN
jgi:hypothetical protein